MLKRSDGPVGVRQRVCGVAAGTAAIMVEGSDLCRRQDTEGLNVWMIGGDTAEQSGWDHTPSVLNTAVMHAPPSSPYISPRYLSPEADTSSARQLLALQANALEADSQAPAEVNQHQERR